MAVEYVLLRWKREFSKIIDDTGQRIDNTATPYPKKSVESNVFIGVQSWIASAFNIVTMTAEEATALSVSVPQGSVREHTRKVTNPNTGTQSTIKVASFKTTTGLSVPDSKIARFKHPSLVGATGKPIHVGIGFPSYFKIPMIVQALGQMIPSNKSPGFCKIEPTYKTYPIILNSADAPLPGTDCGAWVVTADAVDVNTTDTDVIPDDGTSFVMPRAGRG
jgi:hypothetical protein